MNYFASLPTKNYDIEKNKKYRTVTDLGRRVGIRSDMVDILPAYYKAGIPMSERPEMVSDGLYEETNYHWVLMQLNKVVDPYFDWIMSDAVLNEFTERKYPNKSLLLEADHFNPTGYNDGGTPKYFFHVGETITSGTKTGTVVEFDPTIKQIVYKSVTETFADDDLITGYVSGAIGKLASVGTEKEAVHHYESDAPVESGLIVNRDYEVTYSGIDYGSSSVSNQFYELNRNEKNREISVLNRNYVQQYVSEFKEKVKQ